MRLHSLPCIITSVLSLALFGDVVNAQSPLGIFDGQSDIGRATAAGSSTYDAKSQAYRVAGSGQNMWGDHDDFHFVWKRMTGNFILSTRARFIGAGAKAHRKIGWTIRPSLETNSAHVSAALHGNGLASIQFRRATGGITEEVRSRDSLPDADAVIQLERRDGVYLMSVGRFGDTLVTQELSSVSLPDTVYVGLFVCAHNDTVVERAAFSNVRITTPAKPDLVAYREYLGKRRFLRLHGNAQGVLCRVVAERPPLFRCLVEDQDPRILTWNRVQRVRPFRERLSVDHHVIAECDLRRLIRAGAPHLVVRHQSAPDGAALGDGAAVVNADVREANCLRDDLML